MKKKVVFCLSMAFMLLLSSMVACGFSTEHLTSSADIESTALQFLTQVAGFDTNNYQIAISALSGPNASLHAHVTPHFYYAISAHVGNDKGEGNVAQLTFKDGSFWLYQLDSVSGTSLSLSGNLGANKQGFNDSLSTVIRAANGYCALFNESSWSDFSQLVSTALQTQKLSVENRDFSLQIQNESTLWAVCYNKIDGQYVSPSRSMQISIAKTGLVTEIANNMIYHVATANVTVSKEQALVIAEPYIQAFAQQNQQQVTATNATFRYEIDGSEQRGDTFAIYPQWSIQAFYDKPGEYNASSYSVTIWADNGEIAANGPDYFYGNSPNTSAPWVLPFLLTPAFVIMFVLVLGAYLHPKRKFRRK